uniref:Dihydroorotase n=1 Tax=mine drainage metagenome TaxID=410659 RepID=E6Q2K9_9ZZZZ
MLVRGGRIVDPRHRIDALRDLRVEGDRIVEIGEHLRSRGDEETIDAVGWVVAPGFIDAHVHLREPGFEAKETLASGTAAAVRGGFTAVCAMPNTEPALDDIGMLARVSSPSPNRERGILARIFPIAAMTRGRSGREILDYSSLVTAGAVAFSDDGSTVADARVMRDVMRALAPLDRLAIVHAEDAALKGDGVMNEGVVSRRLGVAGSPASAEESIVARDLVIGLEVGARLHVAHLSTARSLELVAWARERNARVTCEVTPHHLLITDEAVEELGARAKVNPPLRTAADTRALRDAVRAGAIDFFASDHAPHTDAEKSGDLAHAAVGFSGLEIAVGAYARALPDLSMIDFVALCSTRAAEVLHLPGGTLAVGALADITMFSDRAWRVDASTFASKGRATPFDGWELPRRIEATVVAGRIAYRAEEAPRGS